MKTIINEGGGIQTVIALEDGNLITGTVQDCTAIAEETKALHREGVHGSSEMRHAAKLPRVAVETYLNVNHIDLGEFLRNPVHIKRMCNDPALKDFRIWGGVV